MSTQRQILFATISFFTALSAGIAVWACIAFTPGTFALMKWVPSYAFYFTAFPAASLLPGVFLAFDAISGHLSRTSRLGGTSSAGGLSGGPILFPQRLCSAASKLFYGITIISGATITLALAAFLAWFIIGSRQIAPHDTPRLLIQETIPAPFRRLAFSSDPHFGSDTRTPEATENILASVARGNYDAFFVLGDLSETGFPGKGLETASDTLARFLPETPIATLQENHDYLVDGSYRYRKIFNRDPYWHLYSGPVHLIALDLPWGTERFTQTQQDFLEQTLASISPDDFTIILSHCFFWSSGYIDPDTGKPWYDLPI